MLFVPDFGPQYALAATIDAACVLACAAALQAVEVYMKEVATDILKGPPCKSVCDIVNTPSKRTVLYT